MIVTLLVSAVAGLFAGAWIAGLTYRVGDASRALYDRAYACGRCGCATPAAWALATRRRLSGRVCAGCGRLPGVAEVGIEIVCAASAAACFAAAPPRVALPATVVCWVLAALAASDARHLAVPSAIWPVGVGAALAVGFAGGGSERAASSLVAALLLPLVVLAGAALLRFRTGVDPLGSGDYGALAVAGAAVGVEKAGDVLLGAACFAVALLVFAPRRAALPFAVCIALSAAATAVTVSAAPHTSAVRGHLDALTAPPPGRFDP